MRVLEGRNTNLLSRKSIAMVSILNYDFSLFFENAIVTIKNTTNILEKPHRNQKNGPRSSKINNRDL